jgi:glutamate synthase (NADPH/NADH) small chain
MTNQEARTEAERCLYCFDAPCMEACPAHIDIPAYIGMLRSGNIRGAAGVVKSSNALANVCGSICPEEIYCQSVCTRAKHDSPIEIRGLHLFATQWEARHGYTPLRSFTKKEKSVAVVGGGPSGLGCSFELVKYGYAVTLFEKKKIGGVPGASIPPFRLSSDVLRDDLEFLLPNLSVKREEVRPAKLPGLRKKFDAVYVAIGLGKDRSPGLPAEHLKGVVPVLKFLEAARAKPKQTRVGKNVVVVGGGNVSLDAAATAKRCGAEEVIVIYRRSEKEMRVWKSELEEARRAGVEFRFLTIPVKILGRSSVQGVKCRRTKLSGKKDATGRSVPVEVKGSEFVLKADTIIMAIGQTIESPLATELKRNAKGYVAVDDSFKTSIPGVFAGGDVISGEGTIVQSVAHGKYAARAIDEYLGGSQKEVNI